MSDDPFLRVRMTILPTGWQLTPINLSLLQVPVHDPPVAWRSGEFVGVPIIVAPSLSPDGMSFLPPRTLREANAAGLPVLDAKPGQRP